jgi:uncharacterized protein (TIGR02594 family)
MEIQMGNRAYELAKQDDGTWEWSDGHNPKVLQYFKDVGHAWVKDDETAWCAAFVGAMLKRAGSAHTGKLNARSYLDWGEEVEHLDEAAEGDIAVFWRGSPDSWQGHVGFYVRHDETYVYVLGGNQGNQVNIRPYKRDRLLGIRQDPSFADPSPVAMPKERDTPAKSKTMQSGAVISTSGLAGLISGLGSLDSNAQIALVIVGGVAVLGGLYVMRERLKAWAEGWR